MNQASNTPSTDRNEILVLAQHSYSLVLKRDKKITFKKWAEKIADFYDLSTPRNKEVYDTILELPNATVYKNRYGIVSLFF